MLLECEDPVLFQQIVDEYTAVYQPANAVERDLVEKIIGAKWRIRRLKIIEVALMDYEMADKQEEIEKKLTRFDFGIHMAVSFKGLSDGSRSASLLSRYESRLHRVSLRAHQTFMDVRRAIAAGLLAQPLAPEAPQPPPPAPVAPEPPAAEPAPRPKRLMITSARRPENSNRSFAIKTSITNPPSAASSANSATTAR